MTIWAILPAAGAGRRMGSDTPKQYLSIRGVPVLRYAVNRLLANPAIDHLVVVLHPDDRHWASLAINDSRLSTVNGGERRMDSVMNAMDSLADRARPDDWVLVHDAARPCLSGAELDGLISGLRGEEVGGLLAAPIDDTLKQVDEDGGVSATIDRQGLWAALTPQMFRFDILQRALHHALSEQQAVTDEASAVEALGLRPKIIPGRKSNLKITRESDLQLAQQVLATGDKQS